MYTAPSRKHNVGSVVGTLHSYERFHDFLFIPLVRFRLILDQLRKSFWFVLGSTFGAVGAKTVFVVITQNLTVPVPLIFSVFLTQFIRCRRASLQFHSGFASVLA